MKLDNPLVVQWEYASEERLAKRNQTYRDLTEGVNPDDAVFEAVREAAPERFLDVGCGMGELAERVQKELGAQVVAVDISPRMVELTRARGIDVHLADVQSLPFADGVFDCVAANWVLYHVPDLDRGVSELERVIRRGGRLVAATLGDANMQELWDLLGGDVTAGLVVRVRERRETHSLRTSRRSSGARRTAPSSSPIGARWSTSSPRRRPAPISQTSSPS